MNELPAWLNAWLDWIQINPGWSLLLLALAAGIEGLFIIGIFIPGSVLMFAAGMLAANHVLNPVAALTSAGLGAFIGDACSFAIGRAYRNDLSRLTGRWQFLPRAEHFFRKRGGMSVILGRLIGPLRPFVPAVAGAADYPWVRYLPMACIASTLWVFAYSLPGMAVGATLSIFADIFGRLSLLLGVLLITLFLIYRVLAALASWAQYYAEPTLLRLIDWSHRHRRLGRLGPALADRDQPETPILLVSLLGLVLLGCLLELALRGGLQEPTIAAWNLALLDQFASFRSPLIDSLAQHIRWLTEPPMIAAMTAASTITFVAAGHRREGAHLLAGAVGGGLLFYILSFATTPPPEFLPSHRPLLNAFTELGAGACFSFSLAGLIATHKSRPVRLAVYWTLATITVLGALASLIQGEILPDRGLLLLILAGLWSGLVTLGFRRHQRRPQVIRWLPLSVALAACLAVIPPPPALTQHTPPNPDLLRSRPDRLNLFWQGEPEAILLARGWQRSSPLSIRDVTLWFSDVPLSELPAVPVLLNGHRPDQSWRRGAEIIRLWRQDTAPSPSHQARWVGHYGQLRAAAVMGQVRLPLTKLASWRGKDSARARLAGIPQHYLSEQDLLILSSDAQPCQAIVACEPSGGGNPQ